MGCGGRATHDRLVNEPFSLRASASWMMPDISWPKLVSRFWLKLQAREQINSKHCQGVLTAGKRVYGGVLERLEGRVRREGLSKRLSAICAEVVVLQTADRRQIALSGGANSRGTGGLWRT